MPETASNRVAPPHYQRQPKDRPRSEDKRVRIVETAIQHFAERGYRDARVADIAAALGIAKSSIFQHFGSKEGLFFEVFKRAVTTFARYLDAPPEVRAQGFFEVLRHWVARTENLIHKDWIPYRIYLLGHSSTDLLLKREINRFLISEDPYGTVSFVRFGLERGELRRDLDIEMLVSVIDWMAKRFHEALLTAELDPGLFRQAEFAKKKEARIQQFLAMLERAIGEPRPAAMSRRANRTNHRR